MIHPLAAAPSSVCRLYIKTSDVCVCMFFQCVLSSILILRKYMFKFVFFCFAFSMIASRAVKPLCLVFSRATACLNHTAPSVICILCVDGILAGAALCVCRSVGIFLYSGSRRFDPKCPLCWSFESRARPTPPPPPPLRNVT